MALIHWQVILIWQNRKPSIYFFQEDNCDPEFLKEIIKHYKDKTYPSFKYLTNERPPYNACFQHGDKHVDEIPDIRIINSINGVESMVTSGSTLKILTFDMRKHPIYNKYRITDDLPVRRNSKATITRNTPLNYVPITSTDITSDSIRDFDERYSKTNADKEDNIIPTIFLGCMLIILYVFLYEMGIIFRS